MALAFPDVYEVAMSHLGIKILYGLVNRREDAAAGTMCLLRGTIWKRKCVSVTSLYSLWKPRTPIKDFDVYIYTPI